MVPPSSPGWTAGGRPFHVSRHGRRRLETPGLVQRAWFLGGSNLRRCAGAHHVHAELAGCRVKEANRQRCRVRAVGRTFIGYRRGFVSVSDLHE